MKFIIIFITTFLFADIRVASAGNVAFAIRDLAKEFKKETGINVVPIIASSGKLTAMIEKKAPFDIFMSADMKYPEYLYQRHLSSKPKVYAKGKLVFFSKGLDILQCKKIAIANPKTAPYGKATIEYLKNMHLYDKVKNRLVIAPNISSAFSYAMKVTDCGFVAKSLVFNYPYEDLELKYTPIKQGVVKLNNKPQTNQFFNFIFSKKAQQILEKYGYDVL
jgi:molybdate transport system substrate-binding protein